ncbi:MAG: methyltransferase domain-containing protein [Verrucomicrobia bacterium]|nr:methyltransferase domain-containing protein [Verrucomicrobiota bacterium]
MRKIDKVSLYWKQQEPTLQSMYKKPNAEYLEKHEKAELLSYLPDLQGKKILDLGAGIGRFTRYFSSLAEHLTTVDMAPQFVARNRQDHADCSNITFLCSDALSLQMEDHSLDFIFLNWLLMYLEDHEVEVLLDRIHRWLRPEGELFFRESCDVMRSKNTKNGYFAHYRSLSEYDAFVKEKFTLLKEGHLRTYVHCFADPLQCYWHCRKNPKI